MAFTKKRLYIALLVTTGILYFLYSTSTSVDGHIYRLAVRFKTGNFSFESSSPVIEIVKDKSGKKASQAAALSSPGSPKNGTEDDEAQQWPQETVDAKANLSSSTSSSSSVKSSPDHPPAPQPVKTPIAKDNQTADNSKKVDVVQKIPSKPGAVDVVQGVITRTLYDSGFLQPNVELCPDFGRDLTVAIIITSAARHKPARLAIRNTWGHFQMRRDIAIGFLLGKIPKDQQKELDEESALYGDIIQANFVDSYNNLTLKTISMLEWVDNYCPKTKFVMKTDDDMFINVPKLLAFLQKHKNEKKRIFGRLAKKWKPIRNKSSKYYVSVQQYGQPLFPDFTTGPAYVMTSDIIHDLYFTALDRTYLKLEDVYTTGIVAESKKVSRVHVNEFFNRRVALNPCNIQKGISIHMVKAFEQYDLWKKLLDGKSKC